MRIENVTPIFPPCPTCGKEMKLTGHAPTCESVIYDFLCTDDGDRLSWRPRRVAANSHQLDGLDINVSQPARRRASYSDEKLFAWSPGNGGPLDRGRLLS